MRARASVLLVVVCVAAAFLAAQERSEIVILVTDGRAPLPGASVELSGPDQRTCVTNERGECKFMGVAPGSYQVVVALTGFTTARQLVSVAAGETRRASLALPVASLQETVTVRSESAMVDRTAGVAGSAAPLVVPAPQVAYAPAALGGQLAAPDYARGRQHHNTESYDDAGENPFRSVSADPLSTFSIDVDTASYANTRRFLNEGRLPPAEAVRIEELINYFNYSYPQPTGEQPFSITTELAACPWNSTHRLALIGLQGRSIAASAVPPRNLVFLIDVSGSMMSPDKLPLVQHGLRMLADTLTAKDHVSIVVYAGASGVVLPATRGDRKERIDRAIAELQAGGSTNGGAGIRLAYQLARDNFLQGGVNRVLLATDGDFNVGVVDQSELVQLIERERESGVFLSVLGVGTGNLKDSTMEKLADKGNGNYAYLDSMFEAHRVLVKEAGSTLVTIAKDVKIQVEFNPVAVIAYRLIGYENRLLKNQDFNDDRKDAGEIGAGHSVTAIYEVVPAGIELDRPSVDPLKYSSAEQRSSIRTALDKYAGELATVKLRYKAPDGDVSALTSAVVPNRSQAIGANLGFASAVAEAGMLLRRSPHATGASYNAAIERARRFRGDDAEGYRSEFIRLMEVASSLSKRSSSPSTQQ